MSLLDDLLTEWRQRWHSGDLKWADDALDRFGQLIDEVKDLRHEVVTLRTKLGLAPPTSREGNF